MPDFQKNERRGHERYDTDLKIAFSVNFDLETKIKFHVKEGEKESQEIYTAFGHNINVEGLGFSSDINLKKGDQLLMDVFLPAVKDPIRMEGHVMWCALADAKSGYEGQYRTGVKISKVRGEEVEKTVVFDPANKVQWSIVLESVFGEFKQNILKKKKEK